MTKMELGTSGCLGAEPRVRRNRLFQKRPAQTIFGVLIFEMSF